MSETLTEYMHQPEEGAIQQTGLDATMQLPKDRYQVACVAEEAATFSSGNKGLIQTWEIVGFETKDEQGNWQRQETVRWGDKDVVVKGIKLKKNYVTTAVFDDNKNIDKVKTGKCHTRLVELWSKLGVYEEGESINLLNPPTRCKGIVADAICSAEEYAMRKPPTSEELARGIKQGEVLTDRHGHELKGYSSVLNMILEARSDIQADTKF